MLEQSDDLLVSRIIEFDMDIKAAWSTKSLIEIVEMVRRSEEYRVFLSSQLGSGNHLERNDLPDCRSHQWR